MCIINSKNIEIAVEELCLRANFKLPEFAYKKILNCSEEFDENYLKIILKNAYLADKKQRPLCQDTGQVIVFVKIGQRVQIDGDLLICAINKGVENAYTKGFLRKSVVENVFFDRKNTQNNTPAIIYTEFTNSDNIEIAVLIKGAGSENNSKTIMLNPNVDKENLFNEIKNIVQNAVDNSCPPLFLGIGMGGTLDFSSVLAKKSFVEKVFSPEEKNLAEELKTYLNKNIRSELVPQAVLDVKIKSSATHIACFPLSVAINCHSIRHSACKICENSIKYEKNDYEISDIEIKNNFKNIETSDISALQQLKEGENIFLSGEIYTARDSAHKKMAEMIADKKELPFNLKNKIIFYAGPCPAKENEIIGPIGPTTSYRMDKFAKILFENGVIGTIGKGKRDEELIKYMKNNKNFHFSMIGGVATFYSDCVESAEVVAFEELGPEAVYKLKIKNLPLKVDII